MNRPALDPVLQFDQLADDAIVTVKDAAAILGNAVQPRALRERPPIKRRQLTQRRIGFRVGDLRALIRGEIEPAAA
jgi:hypothetical protein